MQADWDRRVKHDYRFWMSDGYQNDEAMWQAGERDFKIMTAGVANHSEQTFLELGCGVGRLLKPAAKSFKRVIGLDVSLTALEKASNFLSQYQNIELIHGSGFDLKPLEDNSIDFAISFASFSSMPTPVIANYLCELHRVLKAEGTLRLQCYLGKEQKVGLDDTLHVRCFDEDNFRKAVMACGFSVESIVELNLPIQVSYEDLGITAVIVTLKNSDKAAQSSAEVSSILLPDGETELVELEDTNELEYWMALNYAKELLEWGDNSKAKETLEYAVQRSKDVAIDVSDLMERLVNELDAKDSKPVPAAAQIPEEVAAEGDLLHTNMRILADRFPAIHAQLEDYLANATEESLIEVKQSNEGPVVYFNNQCLDHPEKPVAAAKKWTASILNQLKQDDAQSIAVYGLGAGYHIEAIAQKIDRLIVIEPHLAVLNALIRSRDCSTLFSAIKVLAVGDQIDETVFRSDTELYVRPQAQVSASEHCRHIRSRYYGERGLAKLHPKIAVLGPLQGGTLPIAGYTSKALRGLNQRVQDLNVSGFASGFHELDKFVFDDLRKAAARGSYTKMLSEVLSVSLNEKPIDILICMAQAPITGELLTKLRQDGVITVLWFVEDYLRFKYWQPMSQYYDFIFTIQKGDCLSALKQAGAGETHYLPTACDPHIHQPLSLSAEERKRWGSPVSFVGAGYHNRQQAFASLADMPFKIWGTEWPGCKPFDRLVQEEGRRLKPDEYIRIFNSSDINLNLHSSMERDGVDPYGDFVNPRTFELAATGAFQLTDQRSLLPELFSEDEIATFKSVSEMKELIRYYLDKPEERQQKANAARQRVLSDHTYDKRLKEMLSVIYSSKYEQLLRRETSSPWTKMLRRSEPYPELHNRCQKAFERGEEPGLDGLVSDIVNGHGKLSETEQKLLFLFHVRKQIIRMRAEERGDKS